METVVLHKEDNKVTNQKALDNFIELLGRDGRFLLTGKNIKRRSLNQNSYLHVVFTMLVKPIREAGWNQVHNMETAKEFVKGLFLTVTDENEKTGDKVKRVRHTSELTTLEMMEFIDEIQRWAAEYLSFYVPDPGAPVQLFNNVPEYSM